MWEVEAVSDDALPDNVQANLELVQTYLDTVNTGKLELTSDMVYKRSLTNFPLVLEILLFG